MSSARPLVRAFGVTCVVAGGLMATLLAVLPSEPGITAEAGPRESLLITGARLFDGEKTIDRADVLVVAGRVAAIGENLDVPEDARRVEATGHTLLPGLIDAHTHTYGSALTDSLRFGVTTNLDMFTSVATLGEARSTRDRFSRTVRADLYSAGTLATVDGGHGTQFGIPVPTLSSPEEAAAWVRARRDEGSDYIKLVYMPYQDRIPSLDLPTAAALIRAASDEGLMVVAHVSSARGARDMLDAGIDGFVHVFADQTVTPQFVADAAERDVFVIPTLAVLAMADQAGEGARLALDPRLSGFLGEDQVDNLKADFGRRAQGMSLAVALDNVRRLHRGGVTILAGSDAPNPGTSHGVSVHHEIELLARAGLTPREALVAATSAPASRFKIGTRGRLSIGARADLVVVRGNLLADITASRDIAYVFKNGFEVERSP